MPSKLCVIIANGSGFHDIRIRKQSFQRSERKISPVGAFSPYAVCIMCILLNGVKSILVCMSILACKLFPAVLRMHHPFRLLRTSCAKLPFSE